MNWINIKDELPEYNKRVLIAGIYFKLDVVTDNIKERTIVTMACRHSTNGRGEVFKSDIPDDPITFTMIAIKDFVKGDCLIDEILVTHWKPLPTVPKELESYKQINHVYEIFTK